jgi:hypothetical protein
MSPLRINKFEVISVPNIFNTCKKCEVKVRPRTGYEGPLAEYRCRSTFSLTSALDEGGWSTPNPAALPPGKRPGTDFVGLVDTRAGLNVCGKSCLLPGFDPLTVQQVT